MYKSYEVTENFEQYRDELFAAAKQYNRNTTRKMKNDINNLMYELKYILNYFSEENGNGKRYMGDFFNKREIDSLLIELNREICFLEKILQSLPLPCQKK